MSAGTTLRLAILISGRGSNMTAITRACLAGELNARVELAGRNPGLVAASWLRAHELIPAGGDVR